MSFTPFQCDRCGDWIRTRPDLDFHHELHRPPLQFPCEAQDCTNLGRGYRVNSFGRHYVAVACDTHRPFGALKVAEGVRV